MRTSARFWFSHSNFPSYGHLPYFSSALANIFQTRKVALLLLLLKKVLCHTRTNQRTSVSNREVGSTHFVASYKQHLSSSASCRCSAGSGTCGHFTTFAVKSALYCTGVAKYYQTIFIVTYTPQLSVLSYSLYTLSFFSKIQSSVMHWHTPSTHFCKRLLNIL